MSRSPRGYLLWRTGWSVNWDASYISVPFMLADFMGFAFFLLFAASLWAANDLASAA